MAEALDRRPGCLGRLLGLLGLHPASPAPVNSADTDDPDAPPTVAGHAYRLRDDFLSPAEANLLRVLREVVADWALICPKVRLADLVYAPRQEGRQAAFNRVSRKHLDFVLCDAATLRPVLALELDDRSHQRPDRQERDAFVERVLADTGLPLVRLPVQRSYDPRALAATLDAARATAPAAPPTTADEPRGDGTCPRCGAALVRRVARQGGRAGEAFWGCSNFPQCRYTATDRV